jgi:hypothetical protein
MLDNEDVKVAETKTAQDSSPEVQPEITKEDAQTPESSSGEDVKTESSEENKIPYSRVKEMVLKAKEEGKRESKNDPLKNVSLPTNQDDQTKQAVEIVRNIIREETEPLKAQSELNYVMTAYPDFGNYAKDIVSLLKERPYLNYEDAYYMAKGRVGEKVIKEQAKKEVLATLQAKKDASGMITSRPSNPKGMNMEINVWDKKKTLKEIEAEIKAATED